MEQTVPIIIPADHPAYAGHFPGRPILPGVVLLDATLHTLSATRPDDPALFQIKSAKFLSPVSPGEALQLRFQETAAGQFRFEVLAGERCAASGIVAIAAGDT